MIIDISKLLSQDGLSVQIEREIQTEPEFMSDQDIRFNAPVKVKGDLKSVSGLIYLTLDIETSYIAKCSRCLDDTKEELSFTINEVFSKPGLENKNDDVIILDSNEIDLKDIVEQALYCAVPITSLCSSDCRGLCPECGCNLNQTQCDCDTETIDPRLAVLKDFLK